MNKQGIVLSLSTILILVVLVWFSIFYSNKVQRQEENIIKSFEIEKAGFIADDLINDLNYLLGTSIDANQGENYTKIHFNDLLPSQTNKLELIDWNNFIDENYSKQQNTTIDLNLNNLVDGKTELIFTNGLQYDYNYMDSNSILFYKPNSNTNVITYDINVYINDFSVMKNEWNWNPSGDINVNLNFVDLNSESTVNYSGKLDSSIENTYSWNYSSNPNDFFSIKVGLIEGNSRAIQLIESINEPNSFAIISINALIPTPSTELKWFYNADLNYSQGDVNLNKKFELN